MKTPEDILKEALGEIRYKLNGTVTNAQLKWALEEYAKLYHESKVEKISFNLPVIGCSCPSENRTGWTDVKCCNQCGRPIDKLWGKN